MARELFFSPGFNDIDSREFLIKNVPNLLNINLTSNSKYDKVDTRSIDNSSIGIEVEKVPHKVDYRGHDTSWYGNWFDDTNIHNNRLSGLEFGTMNIPERKFPIWPESTDKYIIFSRISTDLKSVCFIMPEIIMDSTKKHLSLFTPKIGYGEPEYFWCFEEKDVLQFIENDNGIFVPIPPNLNRKNDEQSIRKSNLARRAREFHTRKNQESQSILSGEV